MSHPRVEMKVVRSNHLINGLLMLPILRTFNERGFQSFRDCGSGRGELCEVRGNARPLSGENVGFVVT